IRMAAVSGTFNMAHPEENKRRDGLDRLEALAAACVPMGTATITLGAGSRDPDDMWRWHPDNETDAAWDDFLASMREAVEIAQQYSVTLAIEPEVSTVLNSARKARQLLDEIGSPNLQIVIDGANLFQHGDVSHMQDTLDEA